MRARALTVFIAAVIVAACAGDSEPSTTSSDGEQLAATTTIVPEDSQPGDVDEGGGAEDETTTTQDDSDVRFDGGVSGICLDATTAMAAAVNSYATGLNGVTSGNLDEEGLQLAADQLEAMAEAAPQEIREDFRVVAKELGNFYEALAEIGIESGQTPTADQIAELSTLAEVIDEEAFNEASDAIDAWFEENC